MAFEVGQEVIPVVNLITDSGVEIPTAGTSGTVVNRQIQYSYDSVDYYNYQVSLYSPIVLYSGTTMEQYANTFWFTDSDLGGSGPDYSSYDVNSSEELAQQQEGFNKNNSADSVMNTVLSRMNTKSPYYDVVSNLKTANTSHATALNAFDLTNEEVAKTNSRSAGKAGTELGFDSQVFQELSENALGYHDVYAKFDEEIKKYKDQMDAQTKAATAEDRELNKMYYNNYVKTSNNPLVPSVPTPLPNNLSSYQTIQPIESPTGSLLMSDFLGEISFPSGMD